MRRSKLQQPKICAIADSLRMVELEAQSYYPNVPSYYDFLANRVLVQFKPRHEENPGRVQDFELMLSKKMTYDVVSCCVYRHCR